jgi:hypothetical protein
MYELAIILLGSLMYTALLAATLVFLETIANPDDRSYLYSLITKLYGRIRQGDSMWTTLQSFYARHRLMLALLLVLIVLVLVLLSLGPDHGPSKSASATIQFYGVTWSKDHVVVGEEVTVSGKFYVFPWWPKQWSYVGILRAQGSNDKFSTVRSFVGDAPVGTAIRVELGKNYEFSLVMKAEKEGDGTLAVVMELVVGRVIGPEKSIIIEESSVSEFRSGDNADVVVWVALLFIVIGIVFALPKARIHLISNRRAAYVGLTLFSIPIVIVLYLLDLGNATPHFRRVLLALRPNV